MHHRPRALLIIAAALAVPLAIVGMAWGLHQDRQAEVEENSAIQREEARTAVVQLIDAGEAVRAELGERIDQGRDTAAAGRTADAGVLQALNEALSTAGSHHAAPAPEAPSADATMEDIAASRAKAEEWAGELRWMSDELARNIHETERSQAKYRRTEATRKERAERAAESTERAGEREGPRSAAEKLDQAATDLEPLIEDAGFTVQWSEQVAVPGETVRKLRARLAEADKALVEARAILAADPGASDANVVGEAKHAIDDAFDALEEASWRARDAGADGTNGRISRDELCLFARSPEGLKQYLRCDAADAWEQLGADFEEEFGEPLRAEYGYRAYDLQLWAMAVYGGGQAARPGTSNHGWGTAVDLPDGDAWRFGGTYHEWLRANGPGYGWDNPAWARQGNGREEPWHFEYDG